MKKLIQSVRIKPDSAEELKNKAFELSMKKKDFVKESELIHFLIDNYLDDIDIEDGQIMKKKK